MSKYKVYWDITIDGEPKQLELRELWESDLTDEDEVAREIEEDGDLMGDDFLGYPDDDFIDENDPDIVWLSPIVYKED